MARRMRLGSGVLAGVLAGSCAMQGEPAGPPASPASAGEGGAPEDVLAGATPQEKEWMAAALRAERERRERSRLEPGEPPATLLSKVFDWKGDPAPLFRDFETFARSVEPAAETPEVRVEGPDSIPAEAWQRAITEGVALSLGPGRFSLPPRSGPEKIGNLAVRGAGRDRTTLEAGDWTRLLIGEAGGRVALEDLTIEMEGGPALRARGGMFLRGVRFEGFDTGGGGSAAIYVGDDGYLACEDCEFLAGHGRHAGGHGMILRARALAYFRRCVFADTDAAVIVESHRVADGSRIAFEECAFENTPILRQDSEPEVRRRFPVTVTMRDSTVRWGPEGGEGRDAAWFAERRRPEELRDLGGNRFEGYLARATVGDLRRVLAASEERCYGVEFELMRRPQKVALLRETTSGRADVRFATWDGDSLRDASEEWRTNLRPTAIPPGAGDLASLIGKLELPDDAPVRFLGLDSSNRSGDGPVYELSQEVVRWPSWGETTSFDAASGKRIRDR